jgi:hypothetical protein
MDSLPHLLLLLQRKSNNFLPLYTTFTFLYFTIIKDIYILYNPLVYYHPFTQVLSPSLVNHNNFERLDQHVINRPKEQCHNSTRKCNHIIRHTEIWCCQANCLTIQVFYISILINEYTRSTNTNIRYIWYMIAKINKVEIYPVSNPLFASGGYSWNRSIVLSKSNTMTRHSSGFIIVLYSKYPKFLTVGCW